MAGPPFASSRFFVNFVDAVYEITLRREQMFETFVSISPNVFACVGKPCFFFRHALEDVLKHRHKFNREKAQNNAQLPQP